MMIEIGGDDKLLGKKPVLKSKSPLAGPKPGKYTKPITPRKDKPPNALRINTMSDEDTGQVFQNLLRNDSPGAMAAAQDWVQDFAEDNGAVNESGCFGAPPPLQHRRRKPKPKPKSKELVLTPKKKKKGWKMDGDMPDHSDKKFGQKDAGVQRDTNVTSPLRTTTALPQKKNTANNPSTAATKKRVPSLDLSLKNSDSNQDWNVETTRVPLRSARGGDADPLSARSGGVGPQFLNSNKSKKKRAAPNIGGVGASTAAVAQKTVLLGKSEASGGGASSTQQQAHAFVYSADDSVEEVAVRHQSQHSKPPEDDSHTQQTTPNSARRSRWKIGAPVVLKGGSPSLDHQASDPAIANHQQFSVSAKEETTKKYASGDSGGNTQQQHPSTTKHATPKDKDGFLKEATSKGRKAVWDFADRFKSGSQTADDDRKSKKLSKPSLPRNSNSGNSDARPKSSGGESTTPRKQKQEMTLGKTKIIPRGGGGSSVGSGLGSDTRPSTADTRPFSPLEDQTTTALSRKESSNLDRQRERMMQERERLER
jgi:hypothetical protein